MTWTLEQRASLLESLAAGCTLLVSRRAARLSVEDVRALVASDPEVARAVEASERPKAAPDAGWAAAIKASAAQDARALAVSTPARRDAEPSVDDTFARVRLEAERLAPGHLGTLLWIDARCQSAGMPGLDEWWIGTLGVFYESGKMTLTIRDGLRGGKSMSICRSLVNDALFMRRDLEKDVGVIPIMSADKTEAENRFHTIRCVLRACGIGPKKEDGADDPVMPGGLESTYESKPLPSGGGRITVTDSAGHRIEFRIYAAKITGAVGYTAVAGFCDEVDLWKTDEIGVDEVAVETSDGVANPADVVLDRLAERFTTTMDSAHLYIVSASYHGESSAHARKVKEGDTPIQMLAKLGELGAARDAAARSALAASGVVDPRLTEPSDPTSPNIPAWVSNPTKSPIERCYLLSKSRLGPMFGRYGGRPDSTDGEAAEPWVDGIPSRYAEADPHDRGYYDAHGGGYR